ncbi:MAG: Snf7 family protein [Candidatus Odinarchaeia archaeon]
MVFKKLFSRRKPSKEETISKMRAVINTLMVRARNYERKVNESYAKAYEYARQRNIEGAKNALRRWNRYKTLLNQYYQKIDGAERIIENIEIATDDKLLYDAMKEGSKLLSDIHNLMRVDEIMDTKIKIDKITEESERLGEILTAQEDVFEDNAIEKELNKIMSEVEFEKVSELPSTPIEPQRTTPRQERVRKKLEELKKAFEEPEEET